MGTRVEIDRTGASRVRGARFVGTEIGDPVDITIKVNFGAKDLEFKTSYLILVEVMVGLCIKRLRRQNWVG